MNRLIIYNIYDYYSIAFYVSSSHLGRNIPQSIIISTIKILLSLGYTYHHFSILAKHTLVTLNATSHGFSLKT